MKRLNLAAGLVLALATGCGASEWTPGTYDVNYTRELDECAAYGIATLEGMEEVWSYNGQTLTVGRYVGVVAQAGSHYNITQATEIPNPASGCAANQLDAFTIFPAMNGFTGTYVSVWNQGTCVGHAGFQCNVQYKLAGSP